MYLNKFYKLVYLYDIGDMTGGSVLTVSFLDSLFELADQPYQELFTYLEDIYGTTAETNINSLLSMISGRDPTVWRGTSSSPSEDEQLRFFSRLVSFLRESEPEYSMRLSLLDKTASELLADVVSTTESEREEDSDEGRDTTADSDMPVTATFENTLEDAATLEDKLSRLSIAQRSYSHLWKDLVTMTDPRGTIAERIDEALRVYRGIMREWMDEFMGSFAIIEEEEEDEVDDDEDE